MTAEIHNLSDARAMKLLRESLQRLFGGRGQTPTPNRPEAVYCPLCAGTGRRETFQGSEQTEECVCRRGD